MILAAKTSYPAGARRRLVAVVLLLAAWLGAGVLGTASPASAHASLKSSEPAAGARVDTSPRQVTLMFTEGVSLVQDGIKLVGSDGSPRAIGAPTTSGPDVVVPVSESLPDGSYILVFRVVSADTHPVSGAIPFTVGAAVGADAATAQVAQLAKGQEVSVSGAVRTLAGVDRWAGYAGAVLLLGVPAFVLLCWPSGAADPTLRRLTALGGGLVVLTAAASLPLGAAYATGRSLGATFTDGSIPDLVHRSAGQAAVGRIGFGAALVVLLALAVARRNRSVLIAAGVCAACVLMSYSWAGHPSVADYPALTMADDALHLAAVSVWVGGLLCLALRLLRRPSAAPAVDLATVLARWSVVAMGAVALLVVTGSVQAWRELRSVPALWDTAYGRWVLAKIVGLALLLALGDLGRRWVRRYVRERAAVPPGTGTERVGASVGAMLADPAPDSLGTLRRWVLAEVGIAAGVLAVTAVLVVTTPGRAQSGASMFGMAGMQGMDMDMPQGPHVDQTPQSGTAPATPAAPAAGPATGSVELPNAVKVEVSVDPGAAGTPTVTIVVRDLSGNVIDPPEVTASADLASAGLEGLVLQLQRTEPGRYVADGARLPFPGDWRITVTVRTTDIDSGVGTVSVHLL